MTSRPRPRSRMPARPEGLLVRRARCMPTVLKECGPCSSPPFTQDTLGAYCAEHVGPAIEPALSPHQAAVQGGGGHMWIRD
eukprot:6690028-Lingulodinium_polyedra.AAC.1